MPRITLDIRKLLQLDQQQKKGPKLNNINMEIDVDVQFDQQ